MWLVERRGGSEAEMAKSLESVGTEEAFSEKLGCSVFRTGRHDFELEDQEGWGKAKIEA
jgi:hypothetical protein